MCARRREIDGLFLAEQRRRAPLELEHRRILALLLVADLGARHRIAHGLRRLRLCVRPQVDHPNVSLTTRSQPPGRLIA